MNHGQYGLTYIVYLENIDHFLLKAHIGNSDQDKIRVGPYCPLHIVWSMLNFPMVLANSNQETIQTIWFDPYCPCKVFTTFHQKLMLFSVSSALKKLNWRQQNLTHIVLNIMIVFWSVSHFPIFPTNFNQRIIQSDTCYVLRVLSKNIIFFVSNIHKIGIKDTTVWPILPF